MQELYGDLSVSQALLMCGALDWLVVQITEDLDAIPSEVSGYHCKTLCKHPGSCGYSKGQHFELIMLTTYHKPEERSMCRVDRYVEIGIIQVESSHEVALLQQWDDILECHHVKMFR